MIQRFGIKEHLVRHYGIEADLEPIPRGRADNVLVHRRGERWLLKVFQAEYGRARVEQIADFVDFVTHAGYPTREFVTTSNGAKATMLDDRIAVLIPWIDGNTPEPNTLTSPSALVQVGALCARIHRTGAVYATTHALSDSGSGRSVAEKRAALMGVAAEQRQDPEIAQEVEVRIEILDRWGATLARSESEASRGVIHGDFTGAHVVFQGDQAVGVIDVVGEMYIPGWELMRAFFQSVPCGNGSPEAMEESWRAYLAGYGSELPIRQHEVAIAYDVYLLQLAGSTYGLRAPLDRELRAFGRWRTHLAAYLSKHRHRLREMFASCAPDHS